jgi:hypothetical protein
MYLCRALNLVKIKIEHRGAVANALDSYLEGSGFSFGPGERNSDGGFSCFEFIID